MKTLPIVIVAIAGLTLLGVAGSTLSQHTPQQQTPQPSPTSSITQTPVPSQSTTSATTPAPADAVSAHQVKVSTSMGDIVLNLYPEDAPLAVQNFVTLGKRGYYNGTIFHRVIKGFMSQGGDPTGTGSGGESIYGKVFKTEITQHQFGPGALGGARTDAMDTNGSQFFIDAADAQFLNGKYTQFGQTADDASLTVAKAINDVQTSKANDKPLNDVKITGFTITKA